MRVFISAGEPSGDRLGAAVATALRARVPEVQLDGIGGPLMGQAGVDLVHDLRGLSAVGLVEAAGSLPHHIRLLRSVGRRLEQHPYDVVIPVDYPGFNSRVARRARRVGSPVLYFVAPQLWAWGTWRARQLKRAVSEVASILPFEPEFFNALDIPTRFVGHPMLDRGAVPCSTVARSRLGLRKDRRVLAVFPGSRATERTMLWPVFRQAALRLRHDLPDLQVVVAGPPEGVDVDGFLHVDSSSLVASAADAGICKSGTVTLEAAIAGMPMVIAYRVHPWTAAVARRALQVPFIGLVNLVAGRAVAPELLQREMTVENLTRLGRVLLERPSRAATAQRDAFIEIRRALGRPGAADRVAQMALNLAA